MPTSDCGLDSLPNEILCHILSFLPPAFIAEVLPKVSPRFQALIEDQTLWRRRVYARWPAKLPTLPDDWVDCCRQREEHWAAFRRWEDGGVRLLKVEEAHIAPVDALKFIQEGSLCVSGGRDHQLRVWKIGTDSISLHKDFAQAHEAWIWSVEQLDDTTLVSGSFDQTIKTWDLEQQGPVDTFKLPAAVLSLAIRERLLACGTIGHKVHLRDVRAKHDVKEFEYHRNIVLTLAMNDEVIISGSKDGTVAIFDIRAEKVSHAIKLKGYPTAISYDGSQAWVGTSRGYAACIDTRSLPEAAELVMQRRVSNNSIRSVAHSWGSVVLAAGNDNLLVLQPTKAVTSITRQTIKEGIIKASMHNRTICAAGASGELLVWLPQES